MLGANLLAVLVAAFLLGVEVWVVAILALAYVVSREAITVGALVKAAAALGASAIAYVAAVMVIGLLVSP